MKYRYLIEMMSNWIILRVSVGKLPSPLKNPSKGEELIRRSTTGMKPALFLLDPRFNYQSDPLFQHPGVSFPG